MADSFSNKEIKVLLEMLAKHDVTECRIEKGEEKLILKRGSRSDSPEAKGGVQPASVHQVFGSIPGTSYSGIEASAAGGAQEAPASADPPEPSSEQKEEVTKSLNEEATVRLSRALKEVASPMVGTFYRRPAVDAEPYVQVGDTVKKGDVLCIVEAMKLMNEIESEVSGVIAEICLEDGQMVEYGEVLFRIEAA